jgi:hypothetical protein
MQLEQLQQDLQENMTIYISRCQIQRRKHDRHWRLLQQLVDDRDGGDKDMPDEYPPVENLDVANIILELREVYHNNNEEEHMLVDEEEEAEEEVEQAQQPYQLTPCYIE